MGAAAATTSIGEALAAAVDALAAAGVDTPRLDAEVMLAAATGAGRAEIAAHPERSLEGGAGRDFAAMVRRRLRREPVAYVTGRKGFRRIELEVDPRVLVPRPETELLVEVALELGPARVLDVGTGSGAIALAVADELPGAEVVATDTSRDALEVAAANAARLGLADTVRFVEGTVPPDAGAFELVLANLPYVPAADWGALAPEIREHEPREALVPGPGGLEAIERLLTELAGCASRPGAVALEHGAGQAATVERLVSEAGWSGVERRRDLAGIDRVVLGR